MAVEIPVVKAEEANQSRPSARDAGSVKPDSPTQSLDERSLREHIRYGIPMKGKNPPPTMCQRFAGFLFLMYVFGMSSLYLAVILGPWKLVFEPLGVQLWQKLMVLVEGWYFTGIVGYLEYFQLLRLTVYVDADDEDLKLSSKERVLLLSNHRTEVDWLFQWNFALRFNAQDRLRVMLKAALKKLPGPGWAMKCMNFPYVERNWEEDRVTLPKILQSYHHGLPNGEPLWLSMFPEGTTLCKSTLDKSHRFCLKNNLPTTEFVLYPRVKGFELACESYDPDIILDLTFGYPELRHGVRPSPLRLLLGLPPQEVHIHVKKYTRQQYQAATSHAEWLTERYAAKETLLENFYLAGAFGPHPTRELPFASTRDFYPHFRTSFIVTCLFLLGCVYGAYCSSVVFWIGLLSYVSSSFV